MLTEKSTDMDKNELCWYFTKIIASPCIRPWSLQKDSGYVLAQSVTFGRSYEDRVSCFKDQMWNLVVVYTLVGGGAQITL